MTRIIISCLLFGIIAAGEYLVNISTEDDLYNINYGSFYVELYAYKYCFGEEVLLKTSFYGGEICWEESSYDYNSGEYKKAYTDCHNIQQSYIEIDCFGCYAKNGISTEKINTVLMPKPLNEIIN